MAVSLPADFLLNAEQTFRLRTCVPQKTCVIHLNQIQDLRSELFLGEHPRDAFQHCDTLIVNPAVKPGNPHVEECVSRGVKVTSEFEVFVQRCRGRIIAVTGTNGKSTTASLSHCLLSNDESITNPVWLGGNIGRSLLPVVDEIAPEDLVVLEVSSFQLAAMRDAAFAPEIAVLTSFSPNHLDWHSDVDDYRKAKQKLFQQQTRRQFSVIPSEAELSTEAKDGWRIRGNCYRFGVSDFGENGVYLEEGTLILRSPDSEDAVRFNAPANLPGEHNAANVSAAACAAWLAGASPASFSGSLSRWKGLADRGELVAEGRGVRFVNDSASTTPESTIAALNSFSRSVVLLVGGSDKGADLTNLCTAIKQVCHGAVLIGAIAERLYGELDRQDDSENSLTISRADDFESAFSKAVELVPPGGIVLLSPGFASFGWFRDYRDRGRQFTELARQWIEDV